MKWVNHSWLSLCGERKDAIWVFSKDSTFSRTSSQPLILWLTRKSWVETQSFSSISHQNFFSDAFVHNQNLFDFPFLSLHKKFTSKQREKGSKHQSPVCSQIIFFVDAHVFFFWKFNHVCSVNTNSIKFVPFMLCFASRFLNLVISILFNSKKRKKNHVWSFFFRRWLIDFEKGKSLCRF